MWILPPLVGQHIVTLDGKTGHIIQSRGVDFYISWVTRNEEWRRTREFKVQWDNDIQETIQLAWILPIDNAFTDRAYIVFESGRDLRCKISDMEFYLDNQLIIQGEEIGVINRYDDKYRKQRLDNTWTTLTTRRARGEQFGEFQTLVYEELIRLGFREEEGEPRGNASGERAEWFDPTDVALTPRGEEEINHVVNNIIQGTGQSIFSTTDIGHGGAQPRQTPRATDDWEEF